MTETTYTAICIAFGGMRSELGYWRYDVPFAGPNGVAASNEHSFNTAFETALDIALDGEYADIGGEG